MKSAGPLRRLGLLAGLIGIALALPSLLALPSPADAEPAKLILAAPFPGQVGVQSSGARASLLSREEAATATSGVSPAEAIQAIKIQGDIERADFLGQVEAALGRDYAGTWFDNKDAQLDVGIVSSAARQAAAQAVARAGLQRGVTFSPVRSTWAQLIAAKKHWNRRLAELFASDQARTALAAQHNAVLVELSASVAPLVRSQIERDAANSPVNVLATVGPEVEAGIKPQARETKCKAFVSPKAYCDKPITAGVSIVTVNGMLEEFCSAGPLAIAVGKPFDTYVITAGHCIHKENEVWSAFPATGGAKTELGRSKKAEVGLAGDYGEILVENNAWMEAGNEPVFALTAEWSLAGEEKSYPVIREGKIGVGLAECHEGESTGESCGVVKATEVAGLVNEKLVEGLVEDEKAKGKSGDSGGPWVFIEGSKEVLMLGSHVGEAENKNLLYEPLHTELAALKLELLTINNENRQLDKEEQEGNPEILPLPSAKAPLEVKATSGKALIETAGGKFKMECKEDSATGSFTAVRTGASTLKLLGCKSTGVACNSTGAKAEEVSLPLTTELVDLEKGKLVLGLEIALTEAHVECGGGLVSAVLKGTAIAEVSGLTSGTLAKAATALFKQEKGKQTIKDCHLVKEFCEGKTFHLEASVNKGAVEEAGLETEEKLTFAKEAAVDF
jgi:hypothetical protein